MTMKKRTMTKEETVTKKGITTENGDDDREGGR